MSFQSEFVNPMRASRRYKEWAADSPGDRDRFDSYAVSIWAGKRPVIPTMATQFGKALIGAGKPYLPAAAPPPAPPPVTSSSVFAGRGAFVSHDAEVVLRERMPFDWIAVHGDGLEFTTGEPLATPELVARLKAAGYVVHAWYSWDHPNPYGWLQLGCKGFIGQAESIAQKDTAVGAELPSGTPKALVTNNSFPTWPTGFASLPEAYVNVNPQATPGSVASDSINRGCPRDQVFPCFGTWESPTEPAIRIPLSAYVALWGPTGFSCYLAENLTPADISYLKTLPR